MTLIAGFHCSDGILLAADQEEATLTAKRAVNKLDFSIGKGIEHLVVIGKAGNAATSDVAAESLQERFSNLTEGKMRREHKSVIREVLIETYRNYIWKNPDRDRDQLDFSLLIAINLVKSSEQFLYRTAGIVPQPQHSHICIGVGEDLANYYADRLYKRSMSRQELLLLVAFIFREVKSCVRDVGKGTNAAFLYKGAPTHFFGLANLESTIPEVSESLQKFWQDTKQMPGWLIDERLDFGKQRRELKQRERAAGKQ